MAVSQGCIRVTNPVGLGRWPSLTWDALGGFQLLINGTPATAPAVVRAEDRLEVRAAEGPAQARIAVEVAPDGLTAYVTVRPAQQMVYSLTAAPPATRLHLEASARAEPLPHGLDPADVRRALADAGVHEGVGTAAIEAALAEPGTRQPVAHGSPARPGVVTRLWTVLHGQIDQPLPPPDSGPARSRVCLGDPLAQLAPGAPGASGLSVRGETLEPPPVWSPVLVAGAGALLSTDGLTAIAARDGRPHVVVGAEQVLTAVHEVRDIAGALTETADAVEHDGDIWVGGDVGPGVTLRASGMIEVEGQVLRSRLVAGGDIAVVGGAAYALLVAGGRGVLYGQLLPWCEEMARQLQESGGFSPLRRLAALAARVEQHLVEADMPEPGLLGLLARVRLLERSGTAGGVSPDILDALAAEMDQTLREMRLVLAQSARCRVRHLDNTRVEASGDMEVGPSGVRRSQLTVMGDLVVNGPFRGGRAVVGGSASFAALGPSGNDPARVEVSGTGIFRAQEVQPGTLVVRGHDERRFDHLERDVVLAPER